MNELLQCDGESCGDSQQEGGDDQQRQHRVEAFAAMFPYAGKVQRVQRHGNQRQPPPRGGGLAEQVAENQQTAARDEDGLVNLGVALADTQRHRAADAFVGGHVADVVHVEHGHAEQSDGAGRHQQPRGEGVADDEVAAHHRHEAEEEEHEEVAESAVAVGVFAEGVAHGRPDGAGSQQQQHDGLPADLPAIRKADHQQTAYAAEGRCDSNGDAELAHGEAAHLQTVTGTVAAVAVEAAEEVAQLVGEVRQDLEADGGEQREHDDGGAHRAVAGSEKDAHEHARQR